MSRFSRSVRAAAVALALLAGSAAQAQSNPTEYSFTQFMAMADKNTDKMISRQEFIDAMGMVYDKAMKKAKESGKGMKGELMLPESVRQMLEDIARLSKGA